jgi:hypothetical protein
MPLHSRVPYRGYTIEYTERGPRDWRFCVRDSEGYAVFDYSDTSWRADAGIDRGKAWIDTEIAKAGEVAGQ